MPLEQGQIINERYRIAHLITQSAYGGVYRAWDLQNQGPCALKERLGASPEEHELFRNEATRLLDLNHPNLARVFDFFSIPGQADYLVMEFIEGEDLQTIQEKSRQTGIARLAEAQVLPWFMQVCEALSYLHLQTQPFLHGDVKPANIRIDGRGEAVLVDLGFGHLTRPQARAAAGREVTLGYSAPEQYGASPLDPRSDVYALGATLYTMLTGVTPPDSVDLMTGGASLAPARQLNPSISPETDRLIQQAMQVNRNARLPDMRSFKNGLAAAYSRIVAPPIPAGATVATPLAAGLTQAAATPAGPPQNQPPAADAAALNKTPERKTAQILILAIAAVVLLCVILVSVYFLFFRRDGSDQVNASGTQAAQTLEAQVTQNTGLTQTAEAFLTAVVTPLPGTPSPQPPTATLASPQAPSATASACEKASFVADVTIPDNTVMNPRTPFTKIWRVRNDSTCTWDSSYAVVFAGETLMSAQNAVPFPGSTAPGQTVDLAVEMQAPVGPGAIVSNWLMRSPNNVTFGVGGGGGNALYVRILVTAPIQPDGRFDYDFTANACSAQWRSAAGVISCNNTSSDERGSTLPIAQAPLERAQENEPGLWVRPDQNTNGFIVGEYPNYTIKPGDHFVTEVGCLQGSEGCDVSFHLDIQLAGGGTTNLGVWNETYDGKTRVVDLDLTTYAGQTVRFLLRLVANGRPALANGIWFVPSIRNQPIPPTVTAPPAYPTP